MKKVQIYALEFGYGGVEREVITLANSLINIYNIELIFMSKNYDRIPYKINSKIKITYINENTKVFRKLNAITDINVRRFLKTKLTSDIDTVISTNVMFNKYIDDCSIENKIYWEHNHHENSDVILKSILNKIGNFNTIVVPTKKLEEYYKKNTNINVVMIPNVIEIVEDGISSLNSRMLISVGKLVDEKGFDKLIEVMKLVNDKDRTIKLSIVGEGPARKKLENIVVENGLNRFISFYGTIDKNELFEEYLNSSLFVSCSERESFCLSLMEAMTVGVPAVAFYEESLCDVIKNDINGYLIYDGNIQDMANKILEIMNNEGLRRELGNCARETVMFYDVNTIKSDWIKII
ncbi:MAG: glycosyltransferase [Bacilli bacterium]|nr:glycosyltransferase [Bacilli bacterium]